METINPRISIRLATEDDDATLIRLAALDSAAAPRGEVLVADVDGEIVAAAQRRLQDGGYEALSVAALARDFDELARLGFEAVATIQLLRDTTTAGPR